MADLILTLYKPAPEEGLLKDVSSKYLGLTQLDHAKMTAGLLEGIPQRWGLIRANIGLDCDANAGDRYIYLLTYNKHRLTQSGLASHKFVANDANSWNLGLACLKDASTLAQGSYTGVGTRGLMIEGEQYHDIYVSGAKAGDTWQVRLTYLYLGEGNRWI